jgi:protein-S-isoprenylcysteine O-methyltransferase Ste14
MDIKLLNGAVVAILGLLVIATPVLKEMSARDARLNWVAGAVLLVFGILLLYLYARSRKRPSS